MLGAQQAGGSGLETLLHKMPLFILIVHERANAKFRFGIFRKVPDGVVTKFKWRESLALCLLLG